MNLKRHVGALAVSVLLGGGLVGCAVEDERPAPYEPQVTHTPKPKKTDDTGVDEDGLDDDGAGEDSTAEPGSEAEALEPPPIPDAIYEETLEGAEAAARYYFDAAGYGFAALDVGPLEKICHEESATCKMHRDSITRMVRNGDSMRGAEISIGPTDQIFETLDAVYVSFNFTQEAGTIENSANEVVQTLESVNEKMEVLTKYEEGKWRIWAIGKE